MGGYERPRWFTFTNSIMTSTYDIVNSHAFSLQENPPFTRRNDCVHINALKTWSPRTVRALCRSYWGGPHQVLNKDCWWEMWSHPWCNYTSTMHPFGKIERKKSGPVQGRNFWAGTSDHGSTVRLRKRAAREDTRCVQERRIGSNPESISSKCANKHWNSLCHRIQLTAAWRKPFSQV